MNIFEKEHYHLKEKGTNCAIKQKSVDCFTSGIYHHIYKKGIG